MENLKITDVNKSINLNNNSNDNIENNNIENNNIENNNNENNNNSIDNTNNNNNDNQNKTIDDKNNNTSKSNNNNLLNSNAQFFQKITIENFPSKEDLLYITESFFKGKNYFPQIFSNNKDKKTIYFILDNEDFAYNFTMKLNKEKFSNPSYENTNITLTFEQNKNYKKDDKKINKKKLTNENINRLYKGINPNENKKKKEFNNNNNKKSVYEDNKNLLVFPYAEEFKIKDINIKNKTKKLSDNEPYQPKSNFKFREVNKNKWVSSKEFNNL